MSLLGKADMLFCAAYVLLTQSGHGPLTVCCIKPIRCSSNGGRQMRRRKFLTLLVGAVATLPQSVRAQSENLRRIGLLMAYRENDAEAQKYVSAFWDTLKKFGWTESVNFSTTMHWAGHSGVGSTTHP